MKTKLEKIDRVISELETCAKQVKELIAEQSKEIPFVPKRGDFVYCEWGAGAFSIGIYDKTNRNINYFYVELIFNAGTPLQFKSNTVEDYLKRPATDQEKQLLLDKLHEAGKTWDEEKMEIVDWKWRAEQGEIYFTANKKEVKELVNHNDFIDECLFCAGNYFRTKKEAEEFKSTL